MQAVSPLQSNKKSHNLNCVKGKEINLDTEIKDVVPYCNKGSNGYFEVNKGE